MPSLSPSLLRYGGQLAKSTAGGLKRVALSGPGKLALGAGAVVAVGAYGAPLAIYRTRQAIDAPTSKGTFAGGWTPEDSARDAASRDAQAPGPAEFLTSWKGVLVLALVAGIAFVALRGK